MATTGGIHALFILCQGLLEPGDEVIVPDPEWPPAMGNIKAAHAVPVPCPLHESIGWRWDLDELASKVTPKTRAIYVNSPNNPTGGVMTRADIEAIAALAERRGLWVISDEAYEDVVFDEAEHVSIASLPGMYERTISFYTFSKTYAMTGLRLGYVAVKDAGLRERMKKALFYTASNVSSVVQYGGVGALEGSQAAVQEFRDELKARRDLFYAGFANTRRRRPYWHAAEGRLYAFLEIDPRWTPPAVQQESIPWAMAEHLIAQGRIGCVPVPTSAPTAKPHPLLLRTRSSGAAGRAPVAGIALRALTPTGSEEPAYAVVGRTFRSLTVGRFFRTGVTSDAVRRPRGSFRP